MKGETVQLTVCTQARFPREIWLSVKHLAVDNESSANAMLVTLVEEALEARRVRAHTTGFPSQALSREAS